MNLRQLLATLALLTAQLAIAQAPTASGAWLGTLAAGPQTLRIQFHLQPGTTGPGACMLNSIDQGAFGIPCQLTTTGTQIEIIRSLPSAVPGGPTKNVARRLRIISGGKVTLGSRSAQAISHQIATEFGRRMYARSKTSLTADTWTANRLRSFPEQTVSCSFQIFCT